MKINKKNTIIFDDENKPPVELHYHEFKGYIHWIMNEEMIFSCAEDELKMPLYKTIIEDTKKAEKYCKILKINFNDLLKYYLRKGKSIFEITWVLEKIVKSQNNS